MKSKTPFYFALASCILSFISFYFFASALIPTIHNNVTKNTIEYLKTEINYKQFILEQDLDRYHKEYVKTHFEKNLNPDQLSHIASGHWEYSITVNGVNPGQQTINLEGDSLKIEITEKEKSPLLKEALHNLSSVTGGDKSDTLESHIKIESKLEYKLTKETRVIIDPQTKEETKITTITYDFEIKNNPDQTLNRIEIKYSPVFIDKGLSDGIFPEEIYIVKN